MDLNVFKHPVYPYGLNEDLIVRLELNWGLNQNLILCSRDTAATCKLSDISLEYDAIFDELYTTTLSEQYV